MPEAHQPSEAERKAFVEKLAGFRDTLPPAEQGMLDNLVHAALAGRTPDDVATYWFTPSLSGVETRAPGLTTDRWTIESPLSGVETRAPGQTTDVWSHPWYLR
jgi:hypothetical protein